MEIYFYCASGAGRGASGRRSIWRSCACFSLPSHRDGMDQRGSQRGAVTGREAAGMAPVADAETGM